MGNVLHSFQESKLDFKIDKLEEDNYVTWKWQLVNILKAKKLYSAVTDEDCNDSSSRQALGLIGSALSRENMALVVGIFEAWIRLEIVFENKTTFETRELLGKLHSYKIDKFTDVAKSLMDIQTTATKLKLLGEPVSDKSLIGIIMRALPSEYQNFLVAFKLLSPGERTLNHLISNVIAHSKEFDRNDSESIALVANSTSSVRNNDTCNYCKKPGHWIKDCLKLKNKKRYAENQSGLRELTTTPAENIVWFMALIASHGLNKSVWVADSGSSNHMTPNIQ